MVQGLDPRVRKHSHLPRGQQGRRQGQKSEGQADYFPPQKELAVLRYLSQEQLSIRQTLRLLAPPSYK